MSSVEMDLKTAAIAGNKDVVQSLLKTGADVNAPDAHGRTPLSWAAQYGQEEIVRLFLEVQEAKPNFLDEFGRSPLSWAAQYGHDTVVKHILERFANDGTLFESDSSDTDGRTPLSYTAGVYPSWFHGRHEKPSPFPFPFQKNDFADWTNNNRPERRETERETVAKLLLEAKADPQSTDKHGQTPLCWAALTQQTRLKKLYLQRLVNLYLQEGITSDHGRDATRLLFLAIAHHYNEGVSELLSNVSDIDQNMKNNSGDAPLCLALIGCKRLMGYDAEAAKALILHPNIDPNIKNHLGETPLYLAIEINREDEAKELLMHPKIDPNKKDGSGRTPLFAEVKRHQWCYGSDSISLLRELLQHPKTDPNVKCDSGQTPLSIAAQSGYYHVVRELLQHEKTYLNTRDNLGQTPLMLAIKFKHESVVRELLQHPDVDCRSQDNEGRISVWTAVRTGCVEIVKLLFDKTNTSLDFRDQFGRTPLSHAAQHGEERLVEFLLSKETVDPDSKDENGFTPLSFAVQCSHEETVKVFLDPNKNRGKVTFDSQNNDGWTPLSYAATRGDVRTVGLLLETGRVQPDMPTHDGRTPLSLAAEHGYRKVVELLTKNGVNPNFRDKDDRTPLAWAIEGTHKYCTTCSIVSHLLSVGADLDSKDINDQMLLQRVVEKGSDRAALEILSGMKFYDRTPLSWAAETGNETVVKFLLTQDATKVDSEDRGGRTALWRAADARKEPVMKLLARKDNQTFTVFVQEGNELGVRCMLDAGCDANMRDPLGRTLLHVAALHGQYKILEDIIEAGVDINAKDNDEKTPIRLAVEEQETETIEVLLNFSAETELIMADQWSQAYKKVDPNSIRPHAIHILQRKSGAKALYFFGKNIDLEKAEVGNAELRQVLYFTPSPTASKIFHSFSKHFCQFLAMDKSLDP